MEGKAVNKFVRTEEMINDVKRFIEEDRRVDVAQLASVFDVSKSNNIEFASYVRLLKWKVSMLPHHSNLRGKNKPRRVEKHSHFSLKLKPRNLIISSAVQLGIGRRKFIKPTH